MTKPQYHPWGISCAVIDMIRFHKMSPKSQRAIQSLRKLDRDVKYMFQRVGRTSITKLQFVVSKEQKEFASKHYCPDDFIVSKKLPTDGTGFKSDIISINVNTSDEDKARIKTAVEEFFTGTQNSNKAKKI